MLSDDGDMRATVYKNIIDFLLVKLNNDNVCPRDQQIERNELEEQGAIPTQQVEMRIDEQADKPTP